jgi:hypothetical protein
MISDTIDISADEFERQTGWAMKPEGACLGDRCVPLPGPPSDTVHLPTIAKHLKMALVHDEEAGLWSLGPEAGGKALTTAQAADLELPDWRGQPFRLSSARGRRTLLVAWASW